MGAPYTYIKRKTEDAFEELILRCGGEDLESVQVVKGFNGDDLETPRVGILAAGADPEKIGDDTDRFAHVTGNWFVEIGFSVATHISGQDRDRHALICAAVEDVLMRSDVVAQLNAIGISDFTAYHFAPGAGTDSEDIENGELLSVYSGVLYCCPS